MRRSEEEVNNMIKDMVERSKGKYITQGVSFNKTCPRQIELLKKSLMSSVSFSGLAKELLAIRFEDVLKPNITNGVQQQLVAVGNYEPPKNKNIGNFL